MTAVTTIAGGLGPYENTHIAVANSGAAVAHTGTVAETTLATIPIRGGLIGLNGMMRITTLWSVTNNANNKLLRIRFNGTAFASGGFPSVASVRLAGEIFNRNSLSSQVGGPANFSTLYGSTTAAVVTSTHATTGNLNLTITAELASAGDTATLESYIVELFRS